MNKQRLIPFIGGEWHGEAYNGQPTPFREVGNPPRYIGNNNYDPNVITYDIYRLWTIAGKKYYVSDTLDYNQNKIHVVDDVILAPRETPNGQRMREEIERKKRIGNQALVEFSQHQLINVVMSKHEALDNDDKLLADAFELDERTLWTDYKNAIKKRKNYDGEPPMLKPVHGL